MKDPYSAPLTRDNASVSSMMLDVIIALLPALLMGAYYYGFRVLVLTAVSISGCIGFEALYCKWMHRPNTTGDLSACVTGLLLAMSLPVTTPYWAPLLGGAFAIIVVKQFYGGLGKNFMNPALAGRMLLLSFHAMMTTWVDMLERQSLVDGIDAVSTATPMSYLHLGELPPQSLIQLLLGQHGGAMGESASLFLIFGGLYLLARRVISWRIPVSFLGTTALLTLLFPRGSGGTAAWMVCNLLGGGLILGAFFMATDYTTSPVTPRGQVMYGFGCGVLTVVLRYFGSYPDGVGFAILTMNCCVWLLDRIGLPRRFGVERTVRLREWVERRKTRLSLLRPAMPRRHLRHPGTMPGERELDSIRAWGRGAAWLGGTILTVGLGVYAVWLMTSPTIAQRENLAMEQMLEAVMPSAETATETPYTDENARSILAGYQGNDLVGYCIEVEVQGFGGVMDLVVGVNVNGQVTGVMAKEHSEHPDIGGRALSAEYLLRYVGRSGTIRSHGRNGVDAITGATDTCRAVTEGVNKALYVASRLDEGKVQYTDGEV